MGSISPPEANPSSKWDGEADLKPLLVPIEELKHDSRQVRRHGERDLAQLRLSLEGHGQKKPVVVERSTGEVKAGNGTLEAARLLGWTHIAAVQSDDPAYLLRQYAIRDNRTAELSDWDPLPLLDELKDLEALGADLPDIGWLPDDLDDVERNAGAFDVDVTDDPDLPDGDREPFQQMTFTLHDDQAEVVRDAISKAIANGSCSDVNENSNGNALAFICEAFTRG